MPRRRATKQGSRAKPKLPPGGSEAEMTHEMRRKKLDTLLEEFDMEVETRLAKMDREAKDLCKAIQRAARMEVFKMPQNIKKMTMQEFFSTGGSFCQKAMEDYSHEVESLALKVVGNQGNGNQGDGNQATTPTEAPASVANDTCTSQSENEENELVPKTTRKTTRKGRGRAKAGTTTAKKAAPRTSRRRATSKSAASDTDDENVTPAPSRRSTRARRGTNRNYSQYETPAANTGATGLMNAGLNTPMVTPKFDPRLPLTPAVMREAKRGETIMSMSGSPISNPSRLDCEKPGLLTLGNGKVIDVSSEDDGAVENLAMDETTRKNIMMLQENLAKILQHSSQNT